MALSEFDEDFVALSEFSFGTFGVCGMTIFRDSFCTFDFDIFMDLIIFHAPFLIMS